MSDDDTLPQITALLGVLANWLDNFEQEKLPIRTVEILEKDYSLLNVLKPQIFTRLNGGISHNYLIIMIFLGCNKMNYDN